MPKKTERYWPRILLLWSLSIVAVLLLFEFAVRMFFPQVLNYTEFDENLMFRHIPNHEFRYFSPEFDNMVTFNSKGLRDVEHQYEKATGTYRILVLGDSLPIGFQVKMNETFPKLLEQKLNAGEKPGLTYEVINAGVGGYGSENELLFYETEGRKYKPDMVLLAFSMSDIDESMISPLITIKDGKIHRNVPVEASLPKETALYCSRYSHLCAWMYNRALRGLKESELIRTISTKIGLSSGGDDKVNTKSGLSIYEKENSDSLERGLNETFSIVLEFNRKLKEDHAVLVIVPMPQLEQVDEGGREAFILATGLNGDQADMDKFQRIAQKFSKENGIRYIDPLDGLKAQNVNNSFYFNTGGHFNEEGHEVMAKYLYDGLKKQKFI